MTITTKPVALSGYHKGQIIDHSAALELETRNYVTAHDAFGQPVFRARVVRARAVHTEHDRSDGARLVTRSPWFLTEHEATDWLEQQGLLLF